MSGDDESWLDRRLKLETQSGEQAAPLLKLMAQVGGVVILVAILIWWAVR